MAWSWWQKLRKNPFARMAAVVLVLFYGIVLLADISAPYDPYFRQQNGSLLPPTTVYWQDQQSKRWIGPHVYPVTQGPIQLETGDRKVEIDLSQPSPLRLWVKGEPYKMFAIKIPFIKKFSLEDPIELGELELFQGVKGDRHLWGTVGEGRLNLLGTDDAGRDQLSRLIHGGRISLSIGLVGIAISFPLGMLIGGISGYVGGGLDAVLMRLVEVIMTIPSIYLLVVLAGILPAGLSSSQRFLLITLILSFVGWAGLARVIRGEVLSLKERTYVQASQAMGGRSLHIILRHLLPQTATYVIISATLAVPGYIVAEAVLSLIGLGIQQPDPSWGNMLSAATNASILVLRPWLIWPPAALIVITVLCFNLLGDGLRDALDPRSLKDS
jgi:peptide/nickel transport system permease protein